MNPEGEIYPIPDEAIEAGLAEANYMTKGEADPIMVSEIVTAAAPHIREQEREKWEARLHRAQDVADQLAYAACVLRLGGGIVEDQGRIEQAREQERDRIRARVEALESPYGFNSLDGAWNAGRAEILHAITQPTEEDA